MFVPVWGQYRILTGENQEWKGAKVLGVVASTHLQLVEGLIGYGVGRAFVEKFYAFNF